MKLPNGCAIIWVSVQSKPNYLAQRKGAVRILMTIENWNWSLIPIWEFQPLLAQIDWRSPPRNMIPKALNLSLPSMALLSRHVSRDMTVLEGDN